MIRPFALLVLFLVCVAPVYAQGPRFVRFTTLSFATPDGTPASSGAIAMPPATRPDELGMGMGGLLAGLTGAVLGGYVGAAMDRANGCSEWCGLWGGLAGATVGTTVMVPVGVHLSNRQRGSLARGVAWSALVAAVGWGSAMAFDNATPLLLMPFAQIVAAVAAEAGSTPPNPE